MSGRRLLAVLFLITVPLVTPRLRGADEIEYASYLRSLCFDHDLDFTNEYTWYVARDPQGLAGFKGTFLDRREPATGRPINFAPLGSALLWSPFYAVAHVAVLGARAVGSGVAADGLSKPYEAAICYGSAVWGFLGLLLVHDALRRHAGIAEAPATAAVAAIWLGTPLLYYVSLAPGFSHAPSVFAVSLLLWLWLRARALPAITVADWALVGVAGGLCALVREQDGLFLVAPGLDLVLRLARDPRGSVARGVAMAVAAFAAFVPQLFAYHAINGRYGPSQLVARKMSWTSPHFLEVLVDPGHGLFVWAPLLLLATVGLVLAARRDRVPALLSVALLGQVWINGAVESWSQAGAFGSRRFVGASFVFAWGLAVLLAGIPRLGRGALLAVVLVAAWWNVSLMVQFGLKLMDRQQLTWPDVAVNQVTVVPQRMGRVLFLFFTDREQLRREAR